MDIFFLMVICNTLTEQNIFAQYMIIISLGGKRVGGQVKVQPKEIIQNKEIQI